MDDQDLDWLGDLRWRGYPHIQPMRDVASSAPADELPPSENNRGLAQENETLHARVHALSRLAAEFERRLSEAGAAYEGAALEAESRLRDAALEGQHLAGELEAAKAESARLASRDASREADLRLERERRADTEKALLGARRKSEELELEAGRLRSEAAGHAGALEELRRQAAAQNERLLQSKTLTDEDVHLLRSEMREFLAKFHRIQDSFGEKP
jgi:chromosome segregation ATPase